MARMLIVVGLVLVGVGLLMQLGLPLGRLPGDIVIRRGNGDLLLSDRHLSDPERRALAARVAGAR